MQWGRTVIRETATHLYIFLIRLCCLRAEMAQPHELAGGEAQALLPDGKDHDMADNDEDVSVRITCLARLKDKSVKIPSLSCCMINMAS